MIGEEFTHCHVLEDGNIFGEEKIVVNCRSYSKMKKRVRENKESELLTGTELLMEDKESTLAE